MAETTSSKIKAMQAMLEMAKEWEKEGKIQHAIESYEKVIGMGITAKEADQARDALLEIGKRFDREGRKYSAYYLFQKIGYGKEGLSKRPA